MSQTDIATERPELHVHLFGDRVGGHFYNACQWLVGGLAKRTSAQSTYVIAPPRQGLSSLDSVLDSVVDLAFTTPDVNAKMAYEGVGLYDTPRTDLRAIGALPHRDRHALMIATDIADCYGISRIEDVRIKQPPLKLIVMDRMGKDPERFAVKEVLKRYGFSWDDVIRWGGEWIPFGKGLVLGGERLNGGPEVSAELIATGEADGTFNEAIMHCHMFSEQRPMRFFPIDSEVLEDLWTTFGIYRAEIAEGEYPGVEGSGPTMAWENWLLVTIARREGEGPSAS